MGVTVYTTSQCAICHSVMEWMKKENIPYRRVVVDEDEKGMEELIEKSDGAAGVPFTIIKKEDGSEVSVFGFDRVKIKNILGIAP